MRPRNWAFRHFETFWTSLIILGSLAVATLLSRYKAVGLLLSLGIMIADVAANTYALVVLDIPAFGLSVPLQATFLGFILGSLPFVWPRSTLASDDPRRPADGPNQQPNENGILPQRAEPPLEDKSRVQ